MDAITWMGVTAWKWGGPAGFVLFTGLSIIPARLTLGDCVTRCVAAVYLRQRSRSFREWVDKIEGAHLLTWVLRAGLLGAALWGVDWVLRCWVLAGAGALVGVLRVAEDHNVKAAPGSGVAHAGVDAGVGVRNVSKAATEEEEEGEEEDEQEEEVVVEEEEAEKEFDFAEDAALAAAAAAGTGDAGVSVVEVSVGEQPKDRDTRSERIRSLGGFGRLSVGRLSVGAKPGRALTA